MIYRITPDGTLTPFVDLGAVAGGANPYAATTDWEADPFTICSTQPIDLTTDVVITPDTTATFGASWTTPDGTGDFLDAAGNVLTMPYEYGAAVSYRPSSADAQRGEVTLVLTTDDPDGPCEPVSNQVTITILKVDCGTFPWGGN